MIDIVFGFAGNQPTTTYDARSPCQLLAVNRSSPRLIGVQSTSRGCTDRQESIYRIGVVAPSVQTQVLVWTRPMVAGNAAHKPIAVDKEPQR